MEDDDFARRVYCILGVPIDDIGMAGVVERIHNAARTRRPLFLSTPNLNYLMISQRDGEFRRSLLESDLCPADGMGVLLICRLLGVPIKGRVAGSDLPAALQASRALGVLGPLRVTLFGGGPGVGAMARKAINGGNTDSLLCVGAIDPGAIEGEGISNPVYVKTINATYADFLVVALGAQKGQAWLMANSAKLQVPVISHLGATLNFLAGNVRRAPATIQKLGLEWLWRILQEPKLASRYLSDGARLGWMLLTRILPLSLWLRRSRKNAGMPENGVWLEMGMPQYCRIILAGNLDDGRLAPLSRAFRDAARTGRDIRLDFGRLQSFGMGFAGQILMLEKATLRKQRLTIVGATPSVRRALAWCGLGYLHE
jgi:N-acetylglucosaminyldiphosphoundecaprenol N-acetyl-beta-D-mannosaminyltransferase